MTIEENQRMALGEKSIDNNQEEIRERRLEKVWDRGWWLKKK